MSMGKIYRAAIYVRISKEDSDSFYFAKSESDSITNQKRIIQSYLEKMPDITIVRTFEDDGYTGTNFERPGFQMLLEAIKAQEVDCVVVKDFSRLGRDYLGAGKYIEKVFPALGIRFIAVNDDYDSLHPRVQTDNLLIPFKNLLNEQYSRDTSGKIRSSLEAKRQQGLCVANYTVFGYLKDPHDKNHLVVDEKAANVVSEIFKWRLAGLSLGAIADKLNERQIPTPADYKHQNGSRYYTPYKKNAFAKWTTTAVSRILKNEIYCGHMIQGKRKKKSFKLNVYEAVAQERWTRVENTHEAIISPAIFAEVQRLMQEDTRVTEDGTLQPLAGKLYCADCGGAMVRKNIPVKGKKYHYYVCANNKKNSAWCQSHAISVEKLEKAILTVLQCQVAVLLDMDKALKKMDSLAWEQREIKKITAQINALEMDIEYAQKMKLSAYEDLKSGLLDKDEYQTLRNNFADKIEEASESMTKLKNEQNVIVDGLSHQQEFLASFRQYKNIQALDRRVVAALIDRVNIHDGQNIEVVFRYADRFSSIVDYIANENALAGEKV